MYSNSTCQCLWVSGAVRWRLLLSVGISCSLEMSGGCLGDVWWVFGGVRVIFMEIGGTRMCLGLSGFSVPAVWSRNTILSQPWNERIVCTWDILDIKIPKPPNIRFPKIIGFVQFLIFLVPSEKYYKSQSLLITLYHYSVSTIRILFEYRIIRSPLWGTYVPSKWWFDKFAKIWPNP